MFSYSDHAASGNQALAMTMNTASVTGGLTVQQGSGRDPTTTTDRGYIDNTHLTSMYIAYLIYYL